MYSGSENGSSLPDIPEDASRGSSVSSTLQKEYEELLKFAVVAPKLRVASDPYVKESPNRTVISAKADLVTETGDIPSRSVANYKIDGGKDRDLSESSKNTEVVSGDESDSTVTGDRPVARSIRNHNYQNGTQRVVFKDSTEVTRTGYTNQYKPPSALPMISSSGAKALEDLLKDGKNMMSRQSDCRYLHANLSHYI